MNTSHQLAFLPFFGQVAVPTPGPMLIFLTVTLPAVTSSRTLICFKLTPQTSLSILFGGRAFGRRLRVDDDIAGFVK